MRRGPNVEKELMAVAAEAGVAGRGELVCLRQKDGDCVRNLKEGKASSCEMMSLYRVGT